MRVECARDVHALRGGARNIGAIRRATFHVVAIRCAVCQSPRAMRADVWFWMALVSTVALMALALVSGLQRKRRAHLLAGPASMASLVVAILLTEKLARLYAFDPEVQRIHLVCAKVGGLLAIPVVLTGILLWRRPSTRRLHRWAVWIFVVATLVATATGVWMFAGAVPKPQ